jgi:flagellar biosynthesis component FlhA
MVDKAQGEQLTKRIKGVRQSLSERWACCCPPSACATT